jgi:hypothetical protein
MLVFFIVIAIALLIAILISTSKSSKETVISAPSPTTKYAHTRTVKTAAANGGKSCGVMKESCVPKIDCLLNNNWGTCDPVTRKQTKEILRYPEGTGTACDATSQDCIPDINCGQTDWTSCGINGQQTRTTTTQQSGSGTACGPLSQKCKAPPNNFGSTIGIGAVIYPNQYMTSPNGQKVLYLRANGDLWLINGMPTVNGDDISGAYYWTSRTNNVGSGPYYLGFQGDGNLVLYDNNPNAIWSSGSKSGAASLNLQDDGDLVIKNASGVPLWNLGTATINCVQTPWTSCGYDGYQSRTTTTASAYGGTACGALSQSCPAPVDCVVSDWSRCLADYGTA